MSPTMPSPLSIPICRCRENSTFDKTDQCRACSPTSLEKGCSEQLEPPSGQLTPPPSEPGSPGSSPRRHRRRRETSPPASPPGLPSRPSYASEALTSAFSNDEEPSGTIFPESIYWTPRSSMSRRSSLPYRANSDSSSEEQPSPRSTVSSTYQSRTQTPRAQSERPSRYPTPGIRSLSEDGYAPIAAGFARLALERKGKLEATVTTQPDRGRLRSARPSVELEARLFAGPA